MESDINELYGVSRGIFKVAIFYNLIFIFNALFAIKLMGILHGFRVEGITLSQIKSCCFVDNLPKKLAHDLILLSIDSDIQKPFPNYPTHILCFISPRPWHSRLILHSIVPCFGGILIIR